MDIDKLTTLLQAVQNRDVPVHEAVERLKGWPYEDIGFAKVDHYRALNQGFPEVIFGLGKTPEQIAAIFERLAAKGLPVLATRCTRDAYEAVRAKVPDAEYNPLGRTVTVRVNVGSQQDNLVDDVGAAESKSTSSKKTEQRECEHNISGVEALGTVAVVTAGTADLPVAEEAAVSAQAMGCQVRRIFDVGVAGLHRLLSKRDELMDVQVIIVIAGMEGALASVVAGMVDVPVIAVPTSIGYGANFGGLSALLGMLNSCALGVGVVNIDNGFGAAALAATIVRGYRR
ncbi:nickel pincer cofactor biosynthesis protein LarB [Heliobacillus mobilis]|uniref:Nickel pincer cofactor biosynthesis protein LarB n=1 Tax=Heliobacterium mobile TaxID=28064 RepID=A0A6I3SMU1_HELMO|nr:nickel pincer cofactor biosynthesis protein LarB [Heliobacterium mobile]MTV50300.1 nickel pincer cofactor biosynthesis protein LarB [Heliobacterium mobile]